MKTIIKKDKEGLPFHWVKYDGNGNLIEEAIILDTPKLKLKSLNLNAGVVMTESK